MNLPFINHMRNFRIGTGPGLALSAFLLMLTLGISGCASGRRGHDSYPGNRATMGTNDATAGTNEMMSAIPPQARTITLRPGDVVQISFPGAPNLNATQQIRRDGKITLSLVGEVDAAGLTPAELEKKLVDLYSSQLVDKQVNVTVTSSSFPVFVTGAVQRPGKVLSDHPITALEAIMEAGGFDYNRANLKAVKVIRNNNGHMENFKLNLKEVLAGNESNPFYLKPSDIVYVPERFTWF